MEFSQLRLAPSLLAAVASKGFTEPTPIQEKVIPLILQGVDVIGQAKTGTGKTAAFGLAILQLLDTTWKDKRGAVALVLTPTRELAVQVAEEINELGRNTRDSALPVYGGQDINGQLRELRGREYRIIVATPGRMLDHLERGTIRLSGIEMLVVDEADRMLDMGFIDDVVKIIRAAPAHRQMMLFSATMPGEVVKLSERFMHTPEFIKASGDEVNVTAIHQYYVSVEGRLKISALANLLKEKGISKGLIFCRTKHGADRLAGFLHRLGFDAVALHGNLTQNSRDRAMTHFKEGRAQLMIATDLASRGLDIDDVQAVINYDLPEDEKVYLHRIGRTGRAGSTGDAYTLATSIAEERLLKSWGQRLGAPIEAIPADTRKAEFVREEKQSEARPPSRGGFRDRRGGGMRGGREGTRGSTRGSRGGMRGGRRPDARSSRPRSGESRGEAHYPQHQGKGGGHLLAGAVQKDLF